MAYDVKPTVTSGAMKARNVRREVKRRPDALAKPFTRRAFWCDEHGGGYNWRGRCDCAD